MGQEGGIAEKAPARARRSGYIQSLDGWRALAIVTVMMDHDEPWGWHGHSNAAWHEYGGWGVYLFFAISGLLVCTRILEDEAVRGYFRVGDFYVRRLFRIQPAAIVYVAVIAVLSWMGIAHERPSALLGALFLYQNYLFHHADITGRWFLTGHFWTLALEEHFYILLSLLLFFFRRRRVVVFVAVIGLFLLWQRVSHRFVEYDPFDRVRYSDFNMQYLLVPALLALLLRGERFLAFCQRNLRPWVAYLLTAMAIVGWGVAFPGTHAEPGLQAWLTEDGRLWYYSFPLWVMATMLHPESWSTRFLEWRPLKFVGRLSYSVYLWHALFFLGGRAVVGIHSPTLLFLCERPWRYVATFVAACLSYYVVEKPMIRLGHRLAPPVTPGHSDLRGVQPRPEVQVGAG